MSGKSSDGSGSQAIRSFAGIDPSHESFPRQRRRIKLPVA